jgi:hypothetical protein
MRTQTNSSQITDELNSIIKNNKILSEFEVSRLKRDINKNPNTAEKNMLLGILSEHLNDYDSLVNHFEIAVKSSGYDGTICDNYVKALVNFSKFDEAQRKAFEYLDKYPISHTIFSGAEASFWLLDILSYETFKDKYYLSKYELKSENFMMMDLVLEPIVSFIENNQSLQKPIIELMNEVYNGLRDINSSAVTFKIHQDGDTGELIVRIFVKQNTDINLLLDLNESLIDLSIDNGLIDTQLIFNLCLAHEKIEANS